MSRENVELIRRAYAEGYASRTVEGFRELVADDFQFHMRPGWIGRPVYRFEELPEIWADLDDTYTDYTLVPEDFVAVEGYVLVTVRQSARVKESDARVDTTIWHLWRLGAGKVLEAWTFDVKADALKEIDSSRS